MNSVSDKASSIAQHPFVSRKRYHRPHELEGKFKAKSDFVKYFKEAVSATIIFIFNPAVYQLQLYLPPPSTINKDFLKQVLNDEKDFLELSQVKFVTVPVYDELAVGKLWPLMNGNGEFMRYFPDKFSKGRLPDRGYFFNVMNTVEQEYLQGLIKHANEMRNAGTDEKQEHCQIKISDVWWEKLNAMPFISKSNGRTLSLLKRGSKPTPAERKRRKIPLMATPAEFHCCSEEEKSEMGADSEMMLMPIATHSPFPMAPASPEKPTFKF